VLRFSGVSRVALEIWLDEPGKAPALDERTSVTNITANSRNLRLRLLTSMSILL